MQITEELAEKLIKTITEDINMYVTTATLCRLNKDEKDAVSKLEKEKRILLAELQIAFLAL